MLGEIAIARFAYFVLVTLALAAPAAAQALAAEGEIAQPKTGVWVNYESTFSTNLMMRGSDGENNTALVADGARRIFSVILDNGSPGTSWRGLVRWPGDIAGIDGRADGMNWAHYPDLDHAPEDALWLLPELLAHHRPPVPFRYESGAIEELPEAAVLRHRTCERAIVLNAFDRAIASAGNPHRVEMVRHQKQFYEGRPSYDVREVRSLLSVMGATLQPAASSEVETHVQMMEAMRPDYAAEMRAHGRPFRFRADFLSSPRAEAPTICTGWRIDDFPVRTRDECAISGLVDARDGWPFFVVATRGVERGDGSRYSGQAFFWRLGNPVSVPIPPNPCA